MYAGFCFVHSYCEIGMGNRLLSTCTGTGNEKVDEMSGVLEELHESLRRERWWGMMMNEEIELLPGTCLSVGKE